MPYVEIVHYPCPYGQLSQYHIWYDDNHLFIGYSYYSAYLHDYVEIAEISEDKSEIWLDYINKDKL